MPEQNSTHKHLPCSRRVASLRGMSLLWSLRRYVDSIEYRRQEEDRRIKREVRPAEPDGADGDGERARVCDYEGDARGYCPTCLAETMEKK